MGRTYSIHWEENAYYILVGEPGWKRPLCRPTRRWEDNIKIDLRDGIIWTGSIWKRIGPLNAGMNLRVSYNFEKFLSSSEYGGFSRKTQLHVIS
jgi:hypothetical protein